MKEAIRFASYPPDSANSAEIDPRFARLYAEGMHVGSKVEKRFPEAELYEISEKVSHEELVQYLATELINEAHVRWNFYATMDPHTLRTETVRRLFVPRLNEEIDVDDVAHRLQSEDPDRRESAKAYWDSLQPSPADKRGPANVMWGDREKEIARKLQPLIDEAKAAAVALCERWLVQPPVPGFDGADFWSKENVHALAHHGAEISDDEITQYFLGWLLGLTVGSSRGGRTGSFMLYPVLYRPGEPSLLPMVYLPDEASAINPRAFVMLRDGPQLGELWWSMMNSRSAEENPSDGDGEEYQER